MPPPPFATCFSAACSDGFSWSRFGPTFPVEPASFSVWQLPQPAEGKIALPSGPPAPPPPPPWAVVVVVPPPPCAVVLVPPPPPAALERDAMTPQLALPAHLAM